MANKYWETEKPVVVRVGTTEFRHYPVAQKLQVFPVLENTPHGVGRGCTIDLAVMTDAEKTQTLALIGSALGMPDMAGVS